jgi:hypothetical protein
VFSKMTDQYFDVNEILYEELVELLKEQNKRIENDLFKAILSACRLVEAGETVGNASGLAGIGAVSTHYDAKELRPYVKGVMKRAEPKIKKYYERKEQLKKRKMEIKNILSEFKEQLKNYRDDEFITVRKTDLQILIKSIKG